MGLLRYHSPGPGPGCLMLLIIILRLSTTYGKSACRFEHCNRQYEPVDIAHNVKRANVLDYCQVLRTYAECIRATARGCRGNIGYHGTAKMVEARNEENNCSYVLSHVDSFASATAPPHPRAVAETTMCNYGAGRVEPLEYVQCALFGDPHLTTFTNEFYTCKVVGAWPLISNEYLSVQATNEAVLPGSSATATTKLTVIVKMHAVCAAEKTYHAQADALPPAFVDGSSASGPDGALYIEEVVAGRHIVIHARFIGATVVIRRVAGAALTLAALMPRELVRTWGAAGLELCVKGCPAGETIDYRSFLGRGGGGGAVAMATEEAAARCREGNVTDFYFDSCVFDLATTGEPAFREAAHAAQRDAAALAPPGAASRRENRTHLLARAAGTTRRTPPPPTLIAAAMALLLLLRR